MRTFAIVALSAGLAGCVTGTGGTTSDRVAAAFRAMCAAEPVAHTVFLSLAPGRVGVSVVQREAQAHEVAVRVCAAQPTDWQSATAAIAGALADVLVAQNYAERLAGIDRPVIPASPVVVVPATRTTRRVIVTP